MNAYDATTRHLFSSRTLLRASVLGLLTGLVVACSTSPTVETAASTRVTVNHAAATLPGPSYAWVDVPGQRTAESDPRVTDAAFRASLKQAIETALAEKGYQPAAEPSKADLIVAYRVGVRDVEEVDLVSDDGTKTSLPQSALECSGGSCSQIVVRDADGFPTMKVTTADAVEGGLLIEVLEPGTVRVLWSAYNRGTLRQGAVTQSRLVDAARATLAQLPAR